MGGRSLERKPLARQADLVVEHFGDEVLVYDLEFDRAYCLNATAAEIWKHCDGHNTFGQLAKLLKPELSSPAAEEITRLTLQQLSQKKLLADEPAMTRSALVSRRALVRGLGVTAAALPLITSIVSPTPAEAATCLSSGQACTTPVECCSGVCNTPPPGNGTCV